MTQGKSFVLNDVESGQVHPILPKGMNIGRSEKNNITLNDDQVSRLHATIWAHEGQLYIEDHDSTNGTFINDTQVTGTQMLQPGDRVRIGDSTYEIGQTVVAAAEPVPEQPVQPTSRRLPVVPLVIAGGVVILILLGLFFRQYRDTGAVTLPTPTPVATEIPAETETVIATHTPTAEIATLTPPDTSPPVSRPENSTTGMRYPAPTLVSPQNGDHYRGASPIPYPELTWSPVGTLQSDEYYHVVIDYPHSNGIYQEVEFTKDVRWRMPDYLYGLLVSPRECHWFVEVVKVEETDDNGNPTEFVTVSPPSEVWTFQWLEDTAGGGEGGGNPPSPLPTPTAGR